MISKECYSLEWIERVARENRVPDKIIVEKVIRAFSLLESLIAQGCPLVFKGGTSLMLHFDSSKRLSIDIDIVCPPGTDIQPYLDRAKEYEFFDYELVERITPHNVPKSHSKFFYNVTYKTNAEVGHILLDVLFEDNHYHQIESKSIDSPFLLHEGEILAVSLPSIEDLLGDKLTAFAPHTTGIPYMKGEKDCSMEIIKQLYDIASLFDKVENLAITAATFDKYAKVEMKYRNIDSDDTNLVLDDIFNTALCIALRGQERKDEFDRLQRGIIRIKSFIFSETYTIDSAIINASKAAYLAVLLKKDKHDINRFDNNIEALRDRSITKLDTRLNKLKKYSPEAFYYWLEIESLLV